MFFLPSCKLLTVGYCGENENVLKGLHMGEMKGWGGQCKGQHLEEAIRAANLHAHPKRVKQQNSMISFIWPQITSSRKADLS